jgi:hypothetical protein
MRAGSNGMMAEGAAPELAAPEVAHIRVMHEVACDGMAAQAAAPRPYLHAGKHAQESAAAGMPSIRAQLFAGGWQWGWGWRGLGRAWVAGHPCM